VAVQEPSKEIVRVARTLEDIGFDLCLLGSQEYALGKMEVLSGEQLELLRGCFQRCGHPRFRKEFAVSRHVPYGDSEEIKKSISYADIPKLARLIKIVGMLLQTKVYLFWEKYPF
jgi:hypothetical protein